jgi:hypothetical protein
MPSLLARSALLAAFITSVSASPASSQPPAVADPQLIQGAGDGLAPLWDTGTSRLPGHRAARAISAALAPFVTSALPEDAAWEGFLTPANRGTTRTFIEYQGKLVLTSFGVAGSVLTQGLVMWDGTKFEALPAIEGSPSALGVWNNHLIAAAYANSPFRSAILQLDGAVWDTLGKPDSYVWKFSEFQGHLIAGGRFTAVNGVPSSLVAAFDGSSWSNAGTGISGFEVTGLTVHLDKLVAGGSINPAPGVVSLDALGGAWQAVGTGFGTGVTDVLSDGVELYASGRIIDSTLTTTLGTLMHWNGAVWSGTGSPTNWGVTDVYMTRWNGKVVVNVSASTAPGTVGKLAQWDGVALTPIPGDSLNGIAFGIGTWGTKLVATSPNQNGSVPVPNIVTFDGAQWGTVQQAWRPGMSGTTGSFTDMRSWGGKLIVTGGFSMMAEQDHWVRYPDIAAWDGTHWSPLGGGVSAQYVFLGEYAGDLVATGYSFSVRGTPITRVGLWNGTAWSALGTGAPEFTSALAQYQSDLYLASDVNSDPLSRWNGSTWSVVPGLTGGYLEALAPAAGRLVVGGGFAQAGGVPSPNVAFWDGISWEAAGPGVNGDVLTATEWLGQPVIGGSFTASGAAPLSGVAIWDGSQWQPMGTRTIAVDQLRVQDGELFASGDFRLPDDSVVETIAHWTGTDWHVLGSGSNGYAFASYGGYLYQNGYGLVHGHPSHGLSRVPLTAVLDVPRSRPLSSNVQLSVLSNPVRGRARFSFALPTAGHARVTIYDLGGRAFATLADGPFAAGQHEVGWDAPARPGVYFARIDAGSSHVSRRFVVLGR